MIKKQETPPYYDTEDGTVRVYRALVTQVGIGIPTAVVLTNTLGFTPNWQRINTGSYMLAKAGGFPLEKTAVLMGNSWGGGLTYGVRNDIRDENGIPILVEIGGAATDNGLLETLVEITIYP